MSQLAVVINRNENDPSRDRITINTDGRHRSFLLSSEQGQKLYEAVKNKADIEEIRLIASVEAWAVAKHFAISGKTLILDDRDQLRLNGKVVDFGLTDIIKRMAEAGEDIEPLVNFMERVEKNPNKSVADDLYRFLSKGGLPITPEGCFHAYKRVNAEFMSIHSGAEPTWTQIDGAAAVEATGKTHYPLGSTVWMRREDCDEDRGRTCSRGLHACSFDYLQSFSGAQVIDVIIDPQDVTAIPNDYNDAKLRTCKMRVVAGIPEDDVREYFSHVVDRRHPVVVDDTQTAAEATETQAPTDYEHRGHEFGRDDGKADCENGYQYDPAPAFPCEIDIECDATALDDPEATSAARIAFARGYYEGYAAGWNSVDGTLTGGVEDDSSEEVGDEASSGHWYDDDWYTADSHDEDEDEEEEELPSITVAEASQWGTEDGAEEAARHFASQYDGYDNDPGYGARWDDADGAGDRTPQDGCIDAYRTAYNIAYAIKWQELSATGS